MTGNWKDAGGWPFSGTAFSSLWVSLRSADAPPGVALQLVTADPSEGEALTEPGTDIIEAVPMPVEIQQRLAAFVEAHHVERPFVKRKRDRADPEAMAKRAQSLAAEKKLDVAIVVVNREGRVILAHRMDKSSFVNLALAEKKAVTAAATGVPTSLLEKAVDVGKASLLSVPDVAMVGGGVPIVDGDAVVGGVGVSGGSPEDDEHLAGAAIGS